MKEKTAKELLNEVHPKSKGRIDDKCNLTWNEVITLMEEYARGELLRSAGLGKPFDFSQDNAQIKSVVSEEILDYAVHGLNRVREESYKHDWAGQIAETFLSNIEEMRSTLQPKEEPSEEAIKEIEQIIIDKYHYWGFVQEFYQESAKEIVTKFNPQQLTDETLMYGLLLRLITEWNIDDSYLLHNKDIISKDLAKWYREQVKK